MIVGGRLYQSRRDCMKENKIWNDYLPEDMQEHWTVYECLKESEDSSTFLVKETATGILCVLKWGRNRQAEFLRNEMEIMKKMADRKLSGIPKAYRIFEENGEVYLVREYIEGMSLAQMILQKGGISEAEICRISRKICQTAEQFQNPDEPMIHRDIKPENILICNGICKITDFGLAKVASESTRTMSFKGYGTLQYIAPEAWKSEKNTIQMDIYSMGIVFYELALLDYPYDIISNDVDAYRSAHMFSRIKRTNDLKNVLGADVASIILAMLEKPIQKRLKSWEEIEEQLGNPSLEANDDLGNIVSLAIGKKIETDTRIQQQIEEENQKRKEKEDFCNLVRNQFESVIVDFFEQFTDEYNIHLAGNDKCRLQSTSLEGR